MKLFKKLHRGQDSGRSNEIPPPSPSSPQPSPSCAAAAPSPPSPSEVSRGTAPAPAPAVPEKADYISSEEEFHLQLALALSASNSEFREDPDGDQIRAATLLSLGKQGGGGGRSREEDGSAAAESLSRRYWEYNVLDYHEKVVDGFYDIFGLSSGSEIQGKLPTLVDLQTSIGDLGFEAIIVSRAIDNALVELEQVAQCILMGCPAAQVGLLVQRIAELVTEHMGGPVRDANDMLAKWMEKSTELRTSRQTSLLPVGCINVGLSRHRALLFKVLADTVGIPCRLVKGSHYTGVDEDAINIIKLDNEREFLVDLMAAPGTLIPADVLSAKDAQLTSYNSGLSKDIIPWETNNSGDDLSRAERLRGEYKGGNATSFMDDKGVLDKRSRYEKVVRLPRIPSSSRGASSTKTGTSSSGEKNLFPHEQSNQFSSSASAISSKQKGVLEVPLESGSLMIENSNIVPNAQDTTLDPRNLFAELNPFQVIGTGNASAQFRATDNKSTEYQRRRENIALGPGKPQYPPLVWKNRPACNEIPNAKQYNFVEGLFPRNNVGVKEHNASSSHTSTSAGKIYSEGPNINVSGIPNSGVGTSAKEITVSTTGNTGLASSEDNEVIGMNLHGLLDGGHENAQAAKPFISNQSSENKHTEENQTLGLVLRDSMMHEAKEHEKKINGKNDRRKCTHDRFMGTDMAMKDSESSLSPLPVGPSGLDPMLDDVAEWEIPWEDLVIGERIGLGSYGEVYRADWNGTEVAVKKFLDQDFYGVALDEFRSEVRIMRRLRHPNVVLFMGAVTRPPNLSIVSEFLPRGSLYRILHRPNCQIDEKRRIKMALDVAKGMNCLHTSTPTIVHRDLKSPNLLVDKNWTVKVCDFGLSRLKHNTFLSSKSTAGTPEWMAPEVLRNEPSNEKCDVYSFGVILWELATLRMPWSGMNPMQVVGAVGFQDRRLDIPKEVDPLVARIIWECWQTDPSLRSSFAELTTALKSLQRLVIPSHQETPSPPVPQEISVNSTP